MGCNRLFSAPPASPNLLKLHTLLHSNPWGAAKLNQQLVHLRFPRCAAKCALSSTHLAQSPTSGADMSLRSSQRPDPSCPRRFQISGVAEHVPAKTVPGAVQPQVFRKFRSGEFYGFSTATSNPRHRAYRCRVRARSCDTPFANCGSSPWRGLRVSAGAARGRWHPSPG